ncbi:MAG: hypothetical protein HKN32_04215, partial [Flavobacteriales bacterium]|nr:hypothetical protein [Flavobacteriales bacterium]
VYNGLNFRNIQPLAGIELSVEAFAEDSTGTMWLGTTAGVFFMQGDSIVRYENEEKWSFDSVYDLVLDNAGNLWGGTDYGIFKIEGAEVTTFTRNDGLSSNLVNDLFVDSQGILWVSTFGKGADYLGPDGFETLPFLSSEVVFCMEEVDGMMWFGTLNSGVGIYDRISGQHSWQNKESGLPNNQIRALETDDWGNVWVGTSGGGVALYSGQPIRFFNRDNGLPGRRVYTIGQDGAGDYWLGVDEGLIALMHPDSNNLFYDQFEMDGSKVKVLRADGLGQMWAGTEGDGLYIFKQDTLLNFNLGSGLAGNFIKDILHQPDGKVYVATTDGINILTPKKAQHTYDIDLIIMSDGLSENRVMSLCSDRFGRVWFGTGGSGVGVILSDGSVLNFPKEENPGLVSNATRSLKIDRSNWLWIGTAGDGISRMNLSADTLRISALRSAVEMTSDNIYFIDFDADQNAWVGTESGVEKIVMNADRQPLEVFSYGKDEGLLGIETCTNSSFLDDQCNLWFGTIDGLAMTNPTVRVSNEYPPKTSITQVNLFYKPLEDTPLHT